MGWSASLARIQPGAPNIHNSSPISTRHNFLEPYFRSG
jgi:hypothetical protein